MSYIVVRKREKAKSYLVRYRGPDKKLRSKSFRRRVDAENYRKTIDADLLRGEWVDPRRAKIPFGELATEWQEMRLHKTKIRPLTKRDIRPGTFARDSLALTSHLLPRFAETPISQVDLEAVEELKDDLLGTGLAPATVTRTLQVLGQIMKEALRRRLILTNPLDLIDDRPGVESQREAIFLEPDQLNELSETIKPRFRAMVLLGGYRGLRFGEVAGLKLSRLNLLRGTLEVREILVEVSGKLHFGPPKTKQGERIVKLPKFVSEALNEHLGNFSPRGELVFTNPDGSPLRRTNFARRIWRPAVLAADLDKRLTFHGLRHSAVSMLIAEGAQMIEIGAILGWSQNSIPSMVARYGHLLPSRDEHLTDAIERLYRRSAH